AQHEDIVNETLAQLKSRKLPSQVRLDVTKGVLRDRSVNWFVKAYHTINKPELVNKVSIIHHHITSSSFQQSFSLCKA
ncbi:hypothetical protein PAXRUDRAFT_149436, partial [Paxillus rubicundulus Ve08.2h10]